MVGYVCGMWDSVRINWSRNVWFQNNGQATKEHTLLPLTERRRETCQGFVSSQAGKKTSQNRVDLTMGPLRFLVLLCCGAFGFVHRLGFDYLDFMNTLLNVVDRRAGNVSTDTFVMQAAYGGNLITNNQTATIGDLVGYDICGSLEAIGACNTNAPGCFLFSKISCNVYARRELIMRSNPYTLALFVYDDSDEFRILTPDEPYTNQSTGIPTFFMRASDANRLVTLQKVGSFPAFSLDPTSGIAPNEWQALRDLANSMQFEICSPSNPAFCECQLDSCLSGDLPSWKRLMNNSGLLDVDPCTSRIMGTSCVGGHIVSLAIPYHLVAFNFSLLTNFPYLQDFKLGPGSISNISCGLQNLTLRRLTIAGNKLTSFPSCNLASSLEYIDLSSNLFTALPPELGSLPSLQTLLVQGNRLATLPNASNLTSLVTFNVSMNQLTSIPPSFLSLPMIQVLCLTGNPLTSLNFTTALPMTQLWADQLALSKMPGNLNLMTKLQVLTLHANRINDTSLSFDSFGDLLSLDLSQNQFFGPLPSLSSASQLRTLNLAFNSFNGSIPTTWLSLQLTTSIQLQSNNIQAPIHTLSNLASLESVDLSYNNLALSTDPNCTKCDNPLDFVFGFDTNIQRVNLAHNRLAGNLTVRNWNLYPHMTHVDVSNNQLETIDGIMNLPLLVAFDASNNNLTNVDTKFPESPVVVLVSYANNPRLVLPNGDPPAFMTPGLPTLLYQRVNKVCLTVAVNASFRQFQLLFDPEAFQEKFCECVSGTFASADSCTQIPSFQRADMMVGDSIFGSHRQVPGLDVLFASPLAAASPRVRVTEIELRLGPDFNEFTDLLVVYAGNASLLGPRLLSVRGSDSSAIPLLDETYATMRLVSSSPASWPVIILSVLSDEVVIHLQSRSENGSHFTANFSQLLSCPEGYNPVDDDILTCKLIVNESDFELSFATQIILYILVAATCLLIIITAVLFTVYRRTRLVRATSPLFSLLTLFSLFVFSITSVLYTIPADETLCHARTWLTFTPFVALLSFFIAKVNRVRIIFLSTKLADVATLNLSAWHLLRTCAILVGGMLALLGVFSGLPIIEYLVIPVLSDNGRTRVFEHHCVSHDLQPFTIWCIVMGAYVGGILIWGVYNAYLIRKIPSAFNESAHIFNCFAGVLVLVLLCTLFLLVIPTDPNLILVVWGLGQAVAALIIFGTLFAPKLLNIQRKQEDHLTRMSSSVPANHKVSRSQGHLELAPSTVPKPDKTDKDPTLSKKEQDLMDRIEAAEAALYESKEQERLLRRRREAVERVARSWGWTGEMEVTMDSHLSINSSFVSTEK